LQLDNKLLEVPARQLAVEKIFFGADMQTSAEKGDWTKTMQNKKCVISPRLSNWVFVITERDKNLAQVLLDLLLQIYIYIYALHLFILYIKKTSYFFHVYIYACIK